VRDRDRAEREAAAGLAPGSSEWAAAVGKASAESARAYREMEMQMKAAREAASCKRAALLEALFAGSSAAGSSEQAGAQLSTSLSTDAALDVLFNTGYDVEGGSGSLTQDGVRRMRAVIASTSAALKRGSKDSKDSKEVSLLLRRAALLVALGEPYLARADFERVLDLEPTNPEARKYVEIATYGAGFDPYEILGVARNADSEVISLAFRRLARQWHPDRWVSASEAQQIEAETRFKQLNLAQGVLIDAAKRRKYDAGQATVADLVMGWWEKLSSRWGGPAGPRVGMGNGQGAPGLQGAAAMLRPAQHEGGETLTFELTGCGSGVGVGLDKNNVVDMLVPGKPASRWLRMGDRVVEFDGQVMVEQRGGRMEQRKLRDVVKPSDTHTVKVVRL